MLPDHYESWQHAQEKGFDGKDLEERHCCTVMTNSHSISGNSIIPIDSDRFHVASQTNAGWKYVVDTWAAICDCPDFPRIRFCKHLAAVQSKYPTHTPSGASQCTQIPNVFQFSPQASSSLLSGGATQISGEATKVSEVGTQSGALPNRECLMWNCNPWRETARNMHATWKSPKRCQRPSPDLPNSTTQHIGPIGKCKLLFTDPYSGGEQSGKWAKADALSAPANTRPERQAQWVL